MTDMKSLQGLKVLDFSRVLAGPYCTALFADLGADIIKIEPPQGDDYRHVGPFLADHSSALFEVVNRGKRSLVLDLAKSGDRLIAQSLAQGADVLVENFRPGVATKLGIGFAELSLLNPRLVYASISGFGQTGPLAARPAYDIIVQAMSGIMSVTGAPDGPPTLVGESIADVVSGLFGSWAVLAALIERGTTGLGRHVDVSMFDSMLALQPLVAARYLANGKPPQRVGNRHPLSAPFGAFRAADGEFVLAVLNDKLFHALATLIGHPEIARDPGFATDPLRLQNETRLRAIIESWSLTQSASDAVQKLIEAGVPAAPILNAAQAQATAIAIGRPSNQPVAHPHLGSMDVPEQPVRFGNARRGGVAPAPRLDEHGCAIRSNPQSAWATS